MRKGMIILVLLPLLSGCLTTRNSQDPKERPREGTAYTLTHKEFCTSGLVQCGIASESLTSQ